MEPDAELKLVAVLEALRKSIEDWHRELRRLRRQQRELHDPDYED